MELINTKANTSIQSFNGERYIIWKSRVRGVIDETIMAENALQIIDSESRPEDIDISDWIIWNKVAKGIIMRSLGNSTIHYATSDPQITAHKIFKTMDENYMRTSTASEMSIDIKLMNLKYDASKPLSELFEKFDELVSDLQGATGEPLREANKCARLLKTLPKSYDPLVIAIETLTHTDLTLSFVKKRLFDHETKLKDQQMDHSSKVLHIKTKTYQKFKKNNKYDKTLNKNINKNKMKCYHCGRLGHIKKDCFYFKRSQNNNNNQDPQQYEKTAQVATYDESKGFAFMIGYRTLNAGKSKTFLLDSGASDHIVNNEKLFTEYQTINPPIKISTAQDGGYLLARKKGIVKLFVNKNMPVVLEDVLFCKEAVHNLISVPKMQKAGLNVHFNANGIYIEKDGEVIEINYNEGNLPFINCELKEKHSINTVDQSEYELWHKRLGHIGKSKFVEIKNNLMFEDIEKIRNVHPDNKVCEGCAMGKQSRLKYEKQKDKQNVNRPLFVVHTDVCGPITPATINDKSYYVVFIDQFTHYCVTYLISRKSEVFEMFKDFTNKCEAHFNMKLVYLYCDNGGEYLSSEMKQYCKEKGITYHLTVPHTPQLNGVAERMIRTLTEKARSMIHCAKLDKSFWGEAVLTAAYLTNRSPSNALIKMNKTPYELWHNKKPQLKYLKIFGSTVYVHKKIRKDKFEEKSFKGILVGYEPNGYRVWCVERGRVEIARDVIVDETDYLISRPNNKSDEGDIISHPEISINDEIDKKSERRENAIESVKLSTLEEKLENENDSEKENDTELRRSKRIKLLPKVSYEKYLLSAESMINSVPNDFDEIKNRPDSIYWEKAIKEEIDSHIQNQTWQMVSVKENVNIVDCKWVFTIKNDENGKPVRYKARLVAKGFTQQYLTDYDETYAPVARIASFRFILAFANQNKLLIHQMDVKTAFLNGTLKEDIYMKVPQPLVNNGNAVCKLNKAIYGLKQAARCWFEVFDLALKDKGFINSEVDRCIYILDKGDINENIYILLYVDDVIIVTRCNKNLNEFKNYLKGKFQMTDLGEIKHFIGIKIERSENNLYMSQTAYINNILKKYNMHECNPVKTPLPSKLNYEALNSEERCEAPCRNIIGCLMYLMTCTRPDLSTCVNILSRYSSKCNKELWQNLKRVLRYLKGTTELKLVYEANDNNEILTGYVDSDWGGSDTNDRRSTTGYLFKMFKTCTISWNTKRQETVAASSTEAEYIALFEAVREAVWLKALANSINLEINHIITIFEDNQGCIAIANNPVCHRKSKHIDIKYHYIREKIQNKIIKIEYLPTDVQIADVLTKPIPEGKFIQLRKEIRLE